MAVTLHVGAKCRHGSDQIADYSRTFDLRNLTMTTEKAVRDLMRAQQRAVTIGWSANHGCRAVALSVSYVALCLTLDRSHRRH